MCLSQLPLLSSRPRASLGEPVVTGTPPGEGLSSIWVWRRDECAHLRDTTRSTAMSSILSSTGYTGDNCLLPASLPCLGSQKEPGWEKGCWSSVWPSRKLLCFTFSLKMAAELLCKSRLPSVPWLRSQGEHQPPSWPLCAQLPGGEPCIAAKTTCLPSNTNEHVSAPLSSSPLRVPSETGTQPVVSGQPRHRDYGLLHPGSQLGGFSPWKSFSAELHPIPHPGLNSWTGDNTALTIVLVFCLNFTHS